MPSAPMTRPVPAQLHEIGRQRRVSRERRAAADRRGPCAGGARAEEEAPSGNEYEHMRASNPHDRSSRRSVLTRRSCMRARYRPATRWLRPRRPVPSSRWSSSSASWARSRSSATAGRFALGGPRQRAMLAILLLDANRVVSIERLADELYGGARAGHGGRRRCSARSRSCGKRSARRTAIETRPPGYVDPCSRRRARPARASSG